MTAVVFFLKAWGVTVALVLAWLLWTVPPVPPERRMVYFAIGCRLLAMTILPAALTLARFGLLPF